MNKTYPNFSPETLSVIRPGDMVKTKEGISICLTKQGTIKQHGKSNRKR